MNDFKPWAMGLLKSWTAWFGLILISMPEWMPLVQADLQALLPAEKYQAFVRVVGIIVILLRFKTTASIAAKGRPEGGFLHPEMLPVIMALAFAVVLAGCAGPQANRPVTLAEQIEAANLMMGKVSDRLVALSCGKFQGEVCVDPGKVIMPKDAIRLHEDFIEKPHTAMVEVSRLGPGEIGDCLGEPKDANACMAAVNLLLLEADRYLIELAVKEGK